MMKKVGLGIAAFAALGLVGLTTAHAKFPEKNITFIIPYGPGGGFDTYVRKVAPLMEKHLGGKVNVIPKNVPGAGGRKVIASVYRAKPNGYTIAIFNMPGMLLDKILGKKTKFDIEKFTWLGQLAISPYMLAVGTKSPYQSIKALQNAKGLKYAVTSPSSTSYVAGKIMAQALGLNIKFLTGYKGSAKISLSLIRGDTHLSLFSNRSFAKYAKGGDVKGVLSFEKKSPVKGVPTVADIGHSALGVLATERIVGSTPGLPKNIRKVLATALFKAANDPDMKAWSKKTRRALNPRNAKQTSKRVGELVKFYQKYRSVLK